MQNLKPKKHLGQHFLADENIAKKIVSLLHPRPGQQVVEIGPGMGVLTKHLLSEGADLLAIEYDPDAVEYLKAAFPDSKLRVHQGDVLKWNPSESLTEPACFIGNLPYNISSPIMFHLLDHRHLVERAVFMVQKEVADRICANAESTVKEHGILTVLLDCYFEMRKEMKVPPTVFRPPPKVQSAVFSMQARAGVDVDYRKLKMVVKAAFGQRRKTLRNALKGMEFKPGAFPDAWLERRAEALSTSEFVQIADALLK